MANAIFDKRYKTRWICGILVFISTVLAITIFAIDLCLYLTWLRTARRQHLANDMTFHTSLFILFCAPLSSVVGFTMGTGYYKYKRSKYGKYDVRMRKQGRGYWIDPTDAGDKKKEQDAAKINVYLKGKAGQTGEPKRPVVKAHDAHRKTMLNLMNCGLGHHRHAATDEEASPSHLAAPSAHVLHGHVSFANPFGWHTNKSVPTATSPAGPSRLATVTESPQLPKAPERVARSDSIKTCDTDETTKKAVQSIWLTDKLGESAKKGYDGREKRTENWEEDVGKKLDEVVGNSKGWGSGFWGEGKGKGKEE